MIAGRTTECLSFVCCALPSRAIKSTLNWDIARKFWFSFLFIAVVCAKILHIYAHWDSVPLKKLILWGPTFFLQDFFFLLAGYALTQNFKWMAARILAGLVVVVTSLTLSIMAAANTSFYFLTGAEIHWRQAGSVNRDPASINTLLTGLTGLVIVEAIVLVASIFASPYPYNGMEKMMNVWGQALGAISRPALAASKPAVDAMIDRSRPHVERLLSRTSRGREIFSKMKIYEPVPLTDYDEEDKIMSNSAPLLDQPEQAIQTPENHRWNHKQLILGALIIAASLFVFILRCFRPQNESYNFLSQTIILSPFVGVNSEDKLQSITGERELRGKLTALTTPPKFDWLPEGDWPGFRDWETSSNGTSQYKHYNSTEDPLHISNLDQDVIEPLREVLKNNEVKIKHVLVFKMESTRYDVFPLRKGSYVHDRILSSYQDKKIPKDVKKRLANLTHTAERLTGTESGFHKNGTVKPYGGIYASNSYTSGTFTLKSIEGTTCGLSPLVMDFNHEYEHHIYQPCLPQILDVLSANTNDSSSSDFTNWPWHPHFMQSITDSYDHQDRLLPALGFEPENILTLESIEKKHSNDSSFTEKFNFWGYPDHDLADYFRGIINQAEEKHERLFVEHLTGLTHQPWDTPGGKYKELISSSWGGNNDDVNKYLNTIGINDKWFGTVLDILEETGVANETLVIMTGDHGISLLENNGITPYDNPHVANFHVPLVISNPRLPPIEVNSSVTSIQILPTILDLLNESGSLDEQSERAIKDLLPMYEGQSIIRPIINQTEETRNWQFSVMNTGGSMVAMRSAGELYRLIVPLVPEVEWRFTNLEVDPHEEKPIKSFDLETLRSAIAMKYGSEAVGWLNEAARAAQWWVADNWRRYEYSPS
ncbi:uncharacterized protein N7483_005936 [Penicillium malachiteum]|uniref:uncharacterized protein n=1 Tax=Penicillium malachiteum TaxID=1324776 RepID=UPI002547D533|nr:uncharacterized protein N7483_005936 [Penicillium malachiteum]KAJ5731428.1 hypothetical protein N7483_005936 [Penicillium malachiteum]